MKTHLLTSLCSLSLLTSLIAQDTTNNPAQYLSLKLELKQAIAKGNAYLTSQQKETGHWDDQNITALTALPLTAALRDPNLESKKPLPPHLQKSLDWLLTQQKNDGGIYGKGLATYNTSTSMMAILAAQDDRHNPTLLKARAFLVNQQTDWGNKGVSDDKFDGGIGYGGTYAHSDMSNTHLAIEALHHTRQLAQDSVATNKDGQSQPQLNWDAAIKFVSACQNNQATNDDPEAGNDGGFVYFPGNSKAGMSADPNGIQTHNSYGSISYAGLLSLIYAQLEPTDPRVTAVKDWISKNYTLTENPGVGQQGLYYYYQAMAKSLSAANVTTLTKPDGTTIDWRKELATHLLQNQKPDGSWINDNSRWMENNPILVTAYTVLSLEQIYYTLP